MTDLLKLILGVWLRFQVRDTPKPANDCWLTSSEPAFSTSRRRWSPGCENLVLDLGKTRGAHQIALAAGLRPSMPAGSRPFVNPGAGEAGAGGVGYMRARTLHLLAVAADD